jgi:transposase
LFDYKLETMRGINFITAASLISEIGDISKFKTSAKLSRFAGISPVTYASGKTDMQYSNKRGNRQLNKIIRGLAVVLSRPPNKNNKAVNRYFHDYYKKKLSEGKTKMQSIKFLQRLLVNIIFSMMKYKTEYRNPEVIYVEPQEQE